MDIIQKNMFNLEILPSRQDLLTKIHLIDPIMSDLLIRVAKIWTKIRKNGTGVIIFKRIIFLVV